MVLKFAFTTQGVADVRLFVLSALALATTTLTVLAPTAVSAQESGHRIAVVDVAYIFKNNEGIKSQVKQVEENLKAFDTELQGKRSELKSAAEKLKTFQAGSPEYTAQEERVASMESKLRLDMARKRKELADREAKIYYDNYQHIAAGVKVLAQHYKINLVLRYNSEDMNLEQGESVIRGVMKNIVYHDEALDMTPGVMQYLDKVLVAGKQAAGRQ
ncbi:OmpH family outer membrane protein [Aporhodopirellula aestuarii]|uniref:OmpH family outer membrane protein n=1 Tax=Aporhodopirellula aestuarii TaxID=2950107 RepID=UPI0020340B07|nr:OmpH family outer membrane protein [Aporhodopirellula aestuarii]